MRKLGLNKRVQEKYKSEDPIVCIDALRDSLRDYFYENDITSLSDSFNKLVGDFLWLTTSVKNKRSAGLYVDHAGFTTFRNGSTYNLVVSWNYYDISQRDKYKEVAPDSDDKCVTFGWRNFEKHSVTLSRRSYDICKMEEVNLFAPEGSDEKRQMAAKMNRLEFYVIEVPEMIREAMTRVRNKETDPLVSGFKYCLPDKLLIRDKFKE